MRTTDLWRCWEIVSHQQLKLKAMNLKISIWSSQGWTGYGHQLKKCAIIFAFSYLDLMGMCSEDLSTNRSWWIFINWQRSWTFTKIANFWQLITRLNLIDDTTKLIVHNLHMILPDYVFNQRKEKDIVPSSTNLSLQFSRELQCRSEFCIANHSD